MYARRWPFLTPYTFNALPIPPLVKIAGRWKKIQPNYLPGW